MIMTLTDKNELIFGCDFESKKRISVDESPGLGSEPGDYLFSGRLFISLNWRLV